VSAFKAFESFLVRLAETRVYRRPDQRAEVVKWLTQAAEPGRQPLRDDAFEACVEGTQTCADNILITWNRLKVLTIKHDVLAGRYTGQLAALRDIALSLFRLEQIEKLAVAKVYGLYEKRQENRHYDLARGMDIDPLETHLAFQIGLRKALDLPIDVTEMQCQYLAHVSESDLDDALATVRRAEASHFPAWLLLDFEPFMAEIRRQLGSAVHEEITDAALRASEETFEDKLAQALRAAGLPDGEDERRAMGTQLLREIRYATWLPHANTLLAGAGLPVLPPAAHAVPSPTPPSSSRAASPDAASSGPVSR
jgi:hypothetical protein